MGSNASPEIPLPKNLSKKSLDFLSQKLVLRPALQPAGCNNRGQLQTIMNAIDMTAKTFFERFCLVSGTAKFGPVVNCTPTTSTVQTTTIS